MHVITSILSERRCLLHAQEALLWLDARIEKGKGVIL